KSVADPSAREKGKEAKEKKDDGEKKPAPQVWRRKGARPTMARVDVGNGNTLDMVSLHVSVLIDGPRARTVVDQIFRNPRARGLRGPSESRRPPGPGPSYFAMFLGDTRDTMPARFEGRGAAPRLPADALARLAPAELVKNIDTADWGRLQE